MKDRNDGEHSEEHGLPPGELENDPRRHQADPAVATGELSQRRTEAPLERSTIERDREEKTRRDEMIDQMEEFEGPSRREIRGDDTEPSHDPGVSHS